MTSIYWDQAMDWILCWALTSPLFEAQPRAILLPREFCHRNSEGAQNSHRVTHWDAPAWCSSSRTLSWPAANCGTQDCVWWGKVWGFILMSEGIRPHLFNGRVTLSSTGDTRMHLRVWILKLWSHIWPTGSVLGKCPMWWSVPQYLGLCRETKSNADPKGWERTICFNSML